MHAGEQADRHEHARGRACTPCIVVFLYTYEKNDPAVRDLISSARSVDGQEEAETEYRRLEAPAGVAVKPA